MTTVYDVAHGQIFDDNRRWCTCCQMPKITLQPDDNDEWQHKICPTCTSLWPEYEEQVRQLLVLENFSEDIDLL